MRGIYRLNGIVRHYDWGGTDFIPSLLHTGNEEKKPFAEYWMGTHPQGMSTIRRTDGRVQNLDSLAGPLPYLLKVLDVKDMLSIQVHPSKEAAEREFTRENAEGIPLDAPHRNYRDDNHKPELMVALGDFWLLHGFKPPEELADTLLNVVELRELLQLYNQSGYAGLYRHVMEMPQEEVNSVLEPLLVHIGKIYKDKEPGKYTEDYWAARAARRFRTGNDIDRGIFSIYLFNLVHLKKGEGIFQPAGVPHAYLEGQNVEIMASSDNVLRGGLTTKHIDVKELMKHVKCEPTWPDILSPEPVHKEKIYVTPVRDFRLSQLLLAGGDALTLRTDVTEILLVTEGRVTVSSGDDQLVLEAGQPAAVLSAGAETIVRAGQNSTVFRALGPVLPVE